MSLQKFFEEGGSACPYSTRCKIHYVEDNQDFTCAMGNLNLGEAMIIVASTMLKVGSEFQEVKSWAIEHYIKAALTATEISYPGIPRVEQRALVKHQMIRYLDDASPVRHHIGLRNKPLVTICMAPCYPITHPRYSPVTCLVITWLDDIIKVGALPKLRETMRREHGSVYDAMELVLTVPSNVRSF